MTARSHVTLSALLPTSPKSETAFPSVIAHRGASAYKPDNTEAALRLAVDQLADMVEIDVRRCRSGELVISHDPDLAALTGIPARVRDLTLAELRALDAGFCFGAGAAFPERGRGHRILTLPEALAASAPLGVQVEVKNSPDYADFEPGLEVVADTVAACAPHADRVLYSSFHHASAVQLARASGLPAAWIVTWRTPFEEAVERVAGAGLAAVHPDRVSLSRPDARDVVTLAHDARLAVNVWTVDDPEEMRRLADAGVDGIITNVPDVARSVFPRARP